MLRMFCRTGKYLALLSRPDMANIASTIRETMPSVRATQTSGWNAADIGSDSTEQEQSRRHGEQLSRKSLRLLEAHLNYSLPIGQRYSAAFDIHSHNRHNTRLLSSKCRKRGHTKAFHHNLSTAQHCMNNSFITFRRSQDSTPRYGQIVQIFEHRRPTMYHQEHKHEHVTETFLQLKAPRLPFQLQQKPGAKLGCLQPSLFVDYTKHQGIANADDLVISKSSVLSQVAAFCYGPAVCDSTYNLIGLLPLSRDANNE